MPSWPGWGSASDGGHCGTWRIIAASAFEQVLRSVRSTTMHTKWVVWPRNSSSLCIRSSPSRHGIRIAHSTERYYVCDLHGRFLKRATHIRTQCHCQLYAPTNHDAMPCLTCYAAWASTMLEFDCAPARIIVVWGWNLRTRITAQRTYGTLNVGLT